jgi:carboxypeptidase C (cathepsin A)
MGSRIGKRWFLAVALSVCMGLVAGLAAPKAAVAQEVAPYTAKAGMMPIGLDPERPDAEMFHIAYTLDGADPATRPVTFVFNGGPGAASIYLHMSALGPMTVATPGDGSFPAVPARLEPNPDSWIAFTDLVFIDTVGTGYSRTLPGPDGVPVDPSPYYAVDSDLDSIALFIKKWLTQNDRWSSPKGIAGESYGGMRVAALTRILAEKYAINLNRAVLISPALEVELTTKSYSILYPMSLIPTQAAIAAFHGRNDIGTDPSAMAAVEEYATGEYLTGLVTQGRMTDEARAAFHAKLAGLIGLDPALVARHQGRVTEEIFGANLLRDRGLIIDRYDGTQATDDPTPDSYGIGVMDRSLTVLGGVLLAPFMEYVRNDLGYRTDRPYVPLDLAVNMAWNRASQAGGPEDIGIAMAQNPDLKVLVVHGYHDLSTNYFLSRYVLEQTTRAKAARERLYFGTYTGGHMFYLRKASRAEFAADVRGFYGNAD